MGDIRSPISARMGERRRRGSRHGGGGRAHGSHTDRRWGRGDRGHARRRRRGRLGSRPSGLLRRAELGLGCGGRRCGRGRVHGTLALAACRPRDDQKQQHHGRDRQRQKPRSRNGGRHLVSPSQETQSIGHRNRMAVAVNTSATEATSLGTAGAYTGLERTQVRGSDFVQYGRPAVYRENMSSGSTTDFSLPCSPTMTPSGRCLGRSPEARKSSGSARNSIMP